jgi:hypothetical protein
MMSSPSSGQQQDERLTAEDLMYLKITIAYFAADLQIREDMPKAYAAISGPLKEKIERLWRIAANE